MKVLIENYNLEKKEYSQFCSEIAFLSYDEIKVILNEIPHFKFIKQSFKDRIFSFFKKSKIFRSFRNKPIKIVTENYIISKKDQNSVLLEINHKLYEKSTVVDIEDIGLIFQEKSIKFKSKSFFDILVYSLVLVITLLLALSLPIFNIFMISANFITLLQEVK
jgi:hypothetical protein